MSTLATYKALLSQKLGTTGTGFQTTESREAAINEAIGDIYAMYDIPDLFKVATLTFASGKAAKPTDYFRMIKMWDATESTPEYTYLPEDIFDQQSDTASSYWTEDYDTVTSTRKIFIKPTSETSVRIRYVVKPETLVDDSDESNLPANWDDVVAYYAASILANNAAQYDRYQAMKREGDEMAAKAYASTKNRGGVKGGVRLRSRYEKYPITSNRF
jgi:hypothetical protein